ncbi:stonustoxin subunit beta-like [Clupea harengus]|uniref:Stonustoxin subunit beta-like n=1 Tax=Clupea harengus TaxID=7950 RepID=A0A8M1KN81_CLUHA|nr:stonustoxin subunit beta-like [Clupea harengus]
MIRSIERRRCEVKEIIRAQEKAETFPSVSESPEYKDLYCNYVNQGLCFEAVKKSVSSLKGQLEILCKEEVMKISAADSCHFTLDPNTAHRNLFMSEGNRRVEMRNENQSYPDHPERFDGWCQVLCREGVSGRCYWEVEWNGSWGIHIAVVYKSIVRERGPESEFGHNDQSWSLRFSGLSSSSYFWHNNKQTKLHLLCSSRIGVYVNRRAGTLAFYSVSDTMTLLHRVQTTFTHTLYPGFVVGYQSSMKLL